MIAGNAPKREGFDVGSLYYDCGIVRDLNGRIAPYVSTWVYLGIVHIPGCRCISCDKPEHYYHFRRYCGAMASTPREKWDTDRTNIPSLKQALQSMLTWDELMSCDLANMLDP